MVGRGDPGRVEEQARIPASAGNHRPMGQPDLPAGHLRAELSRLRHPELSRRGPAFRLARSSATSSRPPTSKGFTSFSILSPTTPATFSPTMRIATRRRTPLQANGTTIPAGTTSRTRSRALTTVTAGRRCLSTRLTVPNWRRLGRTAPFGPGSSSVRTCSFTRGISRIGITTRSMPRETCSI